MNLIFDVDGTLWDTTQLVAKAWQRAIDDSGLSKAQITAGQLKGEFGKPMDIIAQNILPDVPLKEDRDVLIEKCCEYEEKCLYDLSREEMDKILFDDLKYTLTKLKEEHDLYIVSNCQKGYIELFLEKSETEHLFKDFLCFGDTGTPKGITIKQLMLNNYLQPKHTLYIGDTRGDYEATLLAGIKFIYAGYGFGNLENMEYEISSLSELL